MHCDHTEHKYKYKCILNPQTHYQHGQQQQEKSLVRAGTPPKRPETAFQTVNPATFLSVKTPETTLKNVPVNLAEKKPYFYKQFSFRAQKKMQFRKHKPCHLT